MIRLSSVAAPLVCLAVLALAACFPFPADLAGRRPQDDRVAVMSRPDDARPGDAAMHPGRGSAGKRAGQSRDPPADAGP